MSLPLFVPVTITFPFKVTLDFITPDDDSFLSPSFTAPIAFKLALFTTLALALALGTGTVDAVVGFALI